MKKIKYLIFEKLLENFPRETQTLTINKNEIKSILLIRQDNRIGNIMFITPLISLIEKEFKIKPDVILGEKFNCILKNNPKVNNVFIYSQKKFLKNPILFFKFIRKIRKKEYDLVIDCKNVFSFNNALLTLFVNSKLKIGFKNLYSDKYLDYTIDPKTLEKKHESEYLASPFINLFNIKSSLPKMSYYFPSNNILKKNSKNKEKEISIHIGGRNDKSLDINLINSIIEKFSDYNINIIYGPNEIKKLKFIKNKENIKTIFPKTIDKLANLINNSDIFISPDTGPLHIASALNKKIIALFTGDTFDRYGPKSKEISLCINTTKESKEKIINKISDFIFFNFIDIV